MRTKEELFKDLGVTDEYNAHAGIPADTKEVILIELLIDIRDSLNTYHIDQARRYGECFPTPN